MSLWNKISLFKYQQIDRINKRLDLSDIDKTLFSICEVFNITEYELDKAGAKKALELSNKLQKIMASDFVPTAKRRIGKYFINYDPAATRFGQYVELSFFLQDPLLRAHNVLASISSTMWRKNRSEDHPIKSAYFLQQPVENIVGSINAYSERFREFNKRYKPLFAQAPSDSKIKNINHPFNTVHGWVYSATTVAEHERITLSEVFDLPTPQALNDLVFIKAKDKYMEETYKK